MRAVSKLLNHKQNKGIRPIRQNYYNQHYNQFYYRNSKTGID